MNVRSLSAAKKRIGRVKREVALWHGGFKLFGLQGFREFWTDFPALSARMDGDVLRRLKKLLYDIVTTSLLVVSLL